jgi:hypothetical protein
VVQIIQYLSSKDKALSLKPSIAKQTKMRTWRLTDCDLSQVTQLVI